MDPKEMSFESVQKEYITKMKYARKLVKEVPWCCGIHKGMTTSALDSIKGSKDRALAALRDGRMEEVLFIRMIHLQSVALDQLSISMENLCVFSEPQINVGSVGVS